MGNNNGCAEVRMPTCQCLPMNTEIGEDDGLEGGDVLSSEERNQETYIECKQEQLGVHFLPTERLRIS